jgi:hypothetical protein
MSKVKTALKTFFETYDIEHVEQPIHDFSNVEAKLGFSLHPELKQYYNSYFYDTDLDGELDIDLSKPEYSQLNYNSEYDEDAFSSLNIIGLLGISEEDLIDEFILKAHEEQGGQWLNKPTGLFYLADMVNESLEEFCIMVNNADGKVYWYDIEDEDDFEKAPKGLLLNSISELFEKLLFDEDIDDEYEALLNEEDEYDDDEDENYEFDDDYELDDDYDDDQQ